MRAARRLPRGRHPRLSGREAARRLVAAGPNELSRRGGRTWPGEIGRQLLHPLALLLWLAALLSLVSGGTVLAAAIVAVVLLNAAVAFVQERHAERAVEALALGREPAEPGLMDRPPRPRSEGVIRPVMLLRAVGLFTNRLLPLPAIVWGTDELWRAWRRRARTAGGAAHPDGTSVGRPARAGRASW